MVYSRKIKIFLAPMINLSVLGGLEVVYNSYKMFNTITIVCNNNNMRFYFWRAPDEYLFSLLFRLPHPPVKSAVVTGKLLSDVIVLGELDNPLMTVVQGCGSM